MKTSKFLFLISSFFILSLCSCEKETAEGPQGPQGEQGPAGEDGEDGNANVHAYEFELTHEDWEWDSDNTRFEHYQTIPQLSSDDFGSGMVMVYSKISTLWATWPISSAQHWWFIHSTGSVDNLQLYVEGWNSQPDMIYSGSRTFKVVVVSEKSYNTNPNLDWSNFQEVSKFFNL